MGYINRLHDFIARRTIKAAQMNQELNQILGILNGGIENVNVKMNAGIRQDQGKLVLDYDAIRAALTTEPNTLDGSVLIDGTVSIDKMEYAENTLVGVGLYANTTPATFPVVIPAGTFDFFMLVFYGATVELTGSDSSDPRTLRLKADNTVMAAAQLGNVVEKISEAGDGFLSKTPSCAWCYIQMTEASNDYAAATPLLVKNQDHEFDMDEEFARTLSKKQIHIFGR